MRKRLSKALLGIAGVALIGLSWLHGQQTQPAPGQAAQSEKKWKDQAEYDLFASITKETDPNKKLTLLNSWKEKYPTTDFKQERLQLYLTTYQGAGKPDKMIEVAKEMLTNDPKDFQALYWIAYLTPNLTTPDLDSAEKAANGLMANLDETFAPAKKPPTTSDADWKKAKTDMEALARKTLGWVAMQKKNNEAAEQEFTKSLQINPNAGEVSYWLGTVILAQKKPERQSEALWHFARAATLDQTQGGLTPQGRQQIDAYFSKAYTSLHGSNQGLNELKTQAKSQPFPPADFKIKSKAEIDLDNEKKEEATNPDLVLWKRLKAELTGPNGQQYFDSSMKGASVPKLKGKVISNTKTEVVLGIIDPNIPEVTLKLDKPIAGTVPPGTEVAFEGVPTSFTKEPFMVTFDVERSKVTGLPAAAPPVRRPPARKAAAKKKR